MKEIEQINTVKITEEQLKGEFNYSQAEKILKKMLEKGLINEVEFNKIDELNRETFSPILNKIMPVNRWYIKGLGGNMWPTKDEVRQWKG